MPPLSLQQAARQLGAFQNTPAFALLQGPRAARSVAPDPLANLSPEQEQSLFRQAGSVAVGGITMAGAALDIESGAIRNLLVGKAPRPHLLSFEGQATGRDVLEKFGILGRNRPGLDFGDILGFGAEVVLDPKTYFTFGASAVGKAGRVLKNAGLWDFLPSAAAKQGITGRMASRQQMTIDKVLDALPKNLRQTAVDKLTTQATRAGTSLSKLKTQPLGGSVRFWPTGTVIGKAGGLGGLVASKLDPVGEAIRFGKYSPIRPAFAALSGETRGFRDAAAQKAAAARGVEYGLRRDAVQQHYRHEMAAIGDQFGDSPQALEAARMHRHYGEGLMPEGLPAGHERAQQGMDVTRGRMGPVQDAELAKGMDVKRLNDVADYLMRQKVTFGDAHYPGITPAVKVRGPFMIPRENLLRNSPKGTLFADDLSLDIAISGTAIRNKAGPGISQATRKNLADDYIAGHAGTTKAEAAAIIREKYPLTSRKGIDLDAAVAHIKGKYAKYIPAGYTEDNFQGLARMVSEWDPRYAERGIGIFGHHPLVDSMNREMFGLAARESADIIYDVLGSAAQLYDDIAPGVVRVSLTQALKQAKLTGAGTDKIGTGAAAEMISRLSDLGVKQDLKSGRLSGSLVDELRKGVPKGTLADDAARAEISSTSILDSIYVPEQVAKDTLGLSNTFTGRETISAMEGLAREFWDPMVDFFKSHVTAYWPAFHNRNYFSGQGNNQIGGAYNWFNPFAKDGIVNVNWRIWAGMRGKPIPGILDVPMVKEAGITDAAEGTRHFFSSFPGMGGKSNTDFATIAGPSSVIVGKDLLSEIPGLVPFSPMKAFGKAIPGSRGGTRPNWWNMRDLEQFAPLQAGKEIGWAIETLNRFAPALAMAERGIDPSEIIKRVKLLQVDYRNVAAADKYIRRMVPFYSFAKGMSTYVAKELYKRPGGTLAQTIRGESLLQREGLDGPVPEHVSKTAAISLGPSLDGGVNVLTGFGFMHEDPLSAFGGVFDKGIIKGVRSAGTTAMQEFTSRLGPHIKVPIELATGVSLFQSGPRGGRPLVDQYGHLGGLLSKGTEAVTGRPSQIKLPPVVEQLPQLLGISRHLSTSSTITDPRKTTTQKAVNLLLGARITTVSPEQQNRLISKSIEQSMSDLGAREFSTLNFPANYLAQLPPAEREERIRLQALKRALAKRQRTMQAANAQQAP